MRVKYLFDAHREVGVWLRTSAGVEPGLFCVQPPSFTSQLAFTFNPRVVLGTTYVVTHVRRTVVSQKSLCIMLKTSASPQR